MSSGKKRGAYCQTESNAGSDSISMSSFAEKRNGHYVLNGRKVFISNGGQANVFIVLAKTEYVSDKPSRALQCSSWTEMSLELKLVNPRKPGTSLLKP